MSSRILDLIEDSQNTVPAILAMVVGVLAGFGAIAFRYLISWANWGFFEGAQQVGNGLAFLNPGRALIILVPAVGMVLVSLIVQRWALEARGHGVPEVQYAIKRKGGRIRLRVAFVKVIASALCIGSGGSIGREGPIVQIGSSLASAIGRVPRLRGADVKILVASGAAGGIAATFNAPIAGVMFALEVILEQFAARSFGLLVISSVSAVAVSHAFLGKQPAFQLVEPFALQSQKELLLYLLLGLFMGMISLAYVRSVYFAERVFERWRTNVHLKALCGGLAVGAMGYFGSQHVFGVGYDGIEMALQSQFTIRFLILLLVLKMVATSLTLGAGGSGGVFAPALFIGAMAGSAFGMAAHQLFPAMTAPAGAYALVGMAALFAGAAHAPITSILILFEMTDDYKIILPLMLSVVVSYLIVSRLSADTIYTIKLRRLGGFAPPRRETSVLETILVADAMSTYYTAVRPELSVAELTQIFRAKSVRSCPVVDADDRLVGVVAESDVEMALIQEDVGANIVSDIMRRNPITCTPDESLRVAIQRFSGQDLYQILVVDRKDRSRLLGVLLRSELMWAYGELADEHQRLLARAGTPLPADYEDSVKMEVHVRTGTSKVCHKRIRDIEVPAHCLIAAVRRGNQTIIPRGDTVIEPGDVLVLVANRLYRKELRSWAVHLNDES